MSNGLHLSLEEILELIREGEEISKGPDVFWREPDNAKDGIGEGQGELRILRRWNSHTPTLYNILGGGYFLWWGGKGTVIDPGCGFLKLFQSETRYNLGHIDMVIVTHDHLDHCHDLASLISLFRQYNSWRVKTQKPPEAPKIWDMLVSYGVADMYASMLEHPDNAPFFFWRRVLPNGSEEVKVRQDIPSFLEECEEIILDRVPFLRAFRTAATEPVYKKYHYTLKVLPAYHKELLGAMTAFGMRIELMNPKTQTSEVQNPSHKLPAIVISGDTAINAGKENDLDGTYLASFYENSDLLVLHVGGLEKKGKKRYSPGGHLGLQGIVEILMRLEKKPKLVILTEWGYEFGRIGANGRTAFVQRVVDDARMKDLPYYAAVEVDGKPPQSSTPEGIPILPADIGLSVRLPDMRIKCGDGGFVEFNKVYAKEVLEEIEYQEIP